MKPKKNENLVLEGKRSIFMQVGLLTVGSLTLAAFTYKSPTAIDDEKKLVQHEMVEFQTEIVDKPEPLVTKQEQQQRNNNNDNDQDQQSIDLNKQVDENIEKKSNEKKTVDPKVGLKDLGYSFGDLFDLKDDLKGEVVEIPDVDASFVGGIIEMKKFINNEVVYPEISLQFNEQGTVWVSFVVETDGEITGIKVERGVSEDLDKEAKRVVRSFPNWIPGEVDAQPVRTRVRLPITFIIEK